MSVSTMIYAAAAAGLTLPLPDGRPWPAAGAWVERDEYVRRRLADKDLVLVDPPAEAGAQAQAEEPPAAGDAPDTDTAPARRRTRS